MLAAPMVTLATLVQSRLQNYFRYSAFQSLAIASQENMSFNPSRFLR